MVEKLKRLQAIIKELDKVVQTLIQLGLELGTLIAIIKLIVESIQ